MSGEFFSRRSEDHARLRLPSEAQQTETPRGHAPSDLQPHEYLDCPFGGDACRWCDKQRGDPIHSAASFAVKTYWNGEPTPCRRVFVRVAESSPGDPRLAWWRGLEGTVRRAVEVRYGGSTFYLDDDDVPPDVVEEDRARCAADPLMSALLAKHPEWASEENPGRAGDGWMKVTEGRGGPSWAHRSLPVTAVMPIERTETELHHLAELASGDQNSDLDLAVSAFGELKANIAQSGDRLGRPVGR